MTSNEEELRAAATKRLNQRRDLGAHVVTYTVVNAALVALWALTGGGYFWPIWVIACWGVGLVLNVWEVFMRRPVTQQDIEREMERLRH